MRFYVWALLLCLIAQPSMAEEMLVSSFCQQIRDYQSGDADYQAGVDVNGNAVAPADLNSIDMPIVDPVALPVEIYLQDYFDLDFPDVPGLELKPTIADLEIFQDGRVLYNGQDISQPLLEQCENQQVVREAVPVTPQAQQEISATSEATQTLKNSEQVDKKAIDVEVLKPQEEPQSEVIEGQYP